MTGKTFKLRTILTITTGCLLTERKGPQDNGISDLYELLEHMTGTPPFTHQLGRFSEECKPFLLEQFPEMNRADIETLNSLEGEPYERVEAFLKLCTSEWGMKDTYVIEPLPQGTHDEKNPILELAEMMNPSRS